MSAVFGWPLPGANLTAVVTKICTACEQPAIDDP